MDHSLPGFSGHGDSPGKDTGVGCPFLLQGIFPTQGWNPHLLQWQVNPLPLSHLGSPSPTLSRVKCLILIFLG